MTPKKKTQKKMKWLNGARSSKYTALKKQSQSSQAITKKYRAIIRYSLKKSN